MGQQYQNPLRAKTDVCWSRVILQGASVNRGGLALIRVQAGRHFTAPPDNRAARSFRLS